MQSINCLLETLVHLLPGVYTQISRWWYKCSSLAKMVTESQICVTFIY